jgi:hypothetical protein
MPTPYDFIAAAMNAPATANPSMLRQGEAARQRRGGVPLDLGFGPREDGAPKGLGFFGALPSADGASVTELSIDSEIDGKEVLMPSVVPTLAREEIAHLLSGGDVTREIAMKAAQHARERMAAGKSPFAGLGEQQFIGNTN